MPDSIYLRDLNIDCIIGLNAHERQRAQRLVLQVELQLDVDNAARMDRLELTVDYESVASQIQFLLHLCQFRLLETACQVLCRTLLLAPVPDEQRAIVDAVKIRIDKPEGLTGRALPGVELHRQRDGVSFANRATSYGQMDVVHETPDLGVYRKLLLPGSAVPVHLHRSHREAEQFLSGGIAMQKVPTATGSIHLWPESCPHGYLNVTDHTQSVLCVSRPAYTPLDETTVVDGDSGPARAMMPSELNVGRIAETWALTQ